MEVRIGVVYSAKELSIEVESKPDEVASSIEDSLKSGGPLLWLTDRKGRRVGVPADKITYIEIAEEDQTKRVGFGPG